MPYRIGKVADRTTPSQVVAPLTCCLLSAFDRHDVPVRFAVLRDALNDVEVRREEYVAEVARLLARVPNMLQIPESRLIRELAETLKAPHAAAARMYLLAFLLPKQDAYVAVWPRGTDLQTFMGVCAGIQKQRDLARARVDLVLQALLRLELEDRFFVAARTVDAPFYIERGNETAVVALAHYHVPFVDAFKRAVAPFVRDLDRAHELVRADFNLFATALRRLPAATSEPTRRMEVLIFGEAGHPEAARVVWAFCSVWAAECLDTFRAAWSLPPETLRRLWSLAREGRTLTLLEATRPFGSRGTSLAC